MCTAVSFLTKDHYFGRNLDLEFSYHETITITPRKYPFVFKNGEQLKNHYAIIGMAYVVKEYPLYYDATNEKGLSVAGLNFPNMAVYQEPSENKINLGSYEFIPWLLCKYGSVAEVKEVLNDIQIANYHFSEELPASPLHFIISDKTESIVVEPVKEGLKVYDNPIGVLTNNPDFNYHLMNVSNYMNVTREEVRNQFAEGLELKPYSRGMGGIGLPRDLSSASRFIKASFTKWNSVCNDTEEESVTQFFHILDSVYQQKGCCRVGKKFEYTIYSSCCNTDKGIYYYKTYENNQITAVDLRKENMDSEILKLYPLIQTQQIKYQN